jgi:hypothetical protein
MDEAREETAAGWDEEEFVGGERAEQGGWPEDGVGEGVREGEEAERAEDAGEKGEDG